MIFVTVGSQKFQFNRLLEQLDKLVKESKIQEEIFAQIGYSTYIPKYYKYKDFISNDEFLKYIQDSNFVICHGGTGSITSALNQAKKVIAIPRQKKYKEHVDDHQLQIVTEFDNKQIIAAVYNIEDLENIINNISNKTFTEYKSNKKDLIEDIDNFIKQCENKK